MQLLSKRDIVFLLLIFLTISCNDNENQQVLQDLEQHKSTLDKKIDEVVKQQNYYQDSINILAKNNQDTFPLAKKLVPLRSAKFLLETQYDTTNVVINNLNNNKIKPAEAENKLKSMNKNLQDLLSKHKLN